PVVIADAEPIEDGLGLVGAVVAAEALDLGRGLALHGDPALEIRVAARERFARLVVAGLRRRPSFETRQHRLARGRITLEAGLLREVADPQAAPGDDAAAVGLLDAREDAAEGALSGAVAADEADALALFEGQGDAVEHGARTVAPDEIVGGQDGHGAGVCEGAARGPARAVRNMLSSAGCLREAHSGTSSRPPSSPRVARAPTRMMRAVATPSSAGTGAAPSSRARP